MMKKINLFTYGFSLALIGASGLVNAQAKMDFLPTTERKTMFHEYLMSELAKSTAERQTAYDAALADKATFEAYQTQMKADYKMILGDLPEKTPLNANIVKSIDKGTYVIEVLSYESRPNHHVTANLYRPKDTTKTYPGIVVPCGHYGIKNIKAMDLGSQALASYQRLGILMAENDLVALIIDPVASGERAQLVNPTTGDLPFAGHSGTEMHSRLVPGSYLAGTSFPAYQVWDNVRGIDFLISRKFIDADKIGVTGSSGGGAQTMFLMGYDDRVKVAGVVSGMTTYTSMWANGGPQDGCQNLAHMGLFHMDQQDCMTKISPVPSMVLQGDQDGLFLSAGAEAGFNDAKKAFVLLGEEDQAEYFHSDEGHGFTVLKRQAAVRWMRTWFYNDNSAIVEPDYTSNILSQDDLLVTSTGQVMKDFSGEKNISMLNLELADSYAQQRADLWAGDKATAVAKVKDLIKLNENYSTPAVEKLDTVKRDGYVITQWKITSGDNVPLPALYFEPNDASAKMPAVLYVDALGKRIDADKGEHVERMFLDSGYVVLSVDLRGFGETKDGLSEAKHNNTEHRVSVITEHIGKSLIGQRVEDIMISLDVLIKEGKVDPNNITIVGVNRAVTAALHAAIIDSRISSVRLWDFPYTSYREIVEAPLDKDNMTHVVVGALKYYDLPDLVNAFGVDKVEMLTGKPVLPPLPDPILSASNPVDNSFNMNIFPNPTSTREGQIAFELVSNAKVNLSVFDLNGAKVMELVDESRIAGIHRIPLKGSSLKKGLYMVRLSVNGSAPYTSKMVIQ